MSPAQAETIQGPGDKDTYSPAELPPSARSIVPMFLHALSHTSMTQRKPMWVVDVSTDWGERAGAR